MTKSELIQYIEENFLEGIPANISPEDIKTLANNLLSYMEDKLADITEIRISAVDTSDAAPTKAGVYIPKAAGTYANYGGIVIGAADVGKFAIVYDGSVFTKSALTITLDVSGIVQSGETKAVTGGEVFNKTLTKATHMQRVNLFDPSIVYTKYYIRGSDGVVASHFNVETIVSGYIPVTAGKYYTISGRIGGKEMRFLTLPNPSGTPIKPMDVNGVSYATYTVPGNGTFLAPPGAQAIQFQLKFNGVGDYSSLQIEEGKVATSYKPYANSFVIKKEYLPELTDISEEDDKSVTLTKSANSLYISSRLSSTNILQWDVLLRGSAVSGSNPTTNLIGEKINGSYIRNYTDDIAPANVNGSHIGGNHGWYFVREINKTAHGKTFADIGAEYVDSSGIKFIIVGIIGVNSFLVLSENKATDAYSYDFRAPTGDLVHSVGGTNTATVTGYTNTAYSNFYAPIQNLVTKILDADGKGITEDKSYESDYFTINEKYDVIDLASIYQRLKATAGGYSANPVLSSIGAESLFRHQITYKFGQDGKMLIFHSFLALKKLNFSFHSFSQTAPFDAASNIYIPKTLPITSGSKTWQMTNGTPFTNPTTRLVYGSAYWENPLSPPDRFVQYNTQFNMHLGYVADKGALKMGADRVDVAIEVTEAKKIYPRAVYFSPAEVMEEGDGYSAIVFKNYTERIAGTIHDHLDVFDVGEYTYIYADFHQPGITNVKIDSSLFGKDIEIVEQNSNVSLPSNFVEESIQIISTATATSYGYVVLRIKNT